MASFLHQRHYTRDLLRDHSPHMSARRRNTSGEPDRLIPDPTNSEHQRRIKIGQRMVGGLLWLSTHTRPDLAFAVSSAPQVLTQDVRRLKVKLRHLLQNPCSSSHSLALLYPYPSFAVFL